MLTQRVVLSKLKQSTINFTIRGRQRHIADFNTRSLFYSKKTAYLFFCSFFSGFTTNHLNLVPQRHFELFTKNGAFFSEPRSRVLNSNQQLLCLSTQQNLYPTVSSSIRQLSALCNSYWLYATVMTSIRQLSALSTSYQLYATVMSSIGQLSALSDS